MNVCYNRCYDNAVLGFWSTRDNIYYVRVITICNGNNVKGF